MRPAKVPVVMALVDVFEVAADQVKIGVTGAATGVNAQTGAAPSRMNINDLYRAGGPAWDLYVQALAELQAVDEDDELSYFKIMGVHGLPFQPFNGVGQVPGGAERAGFCPHNHLLFGLWHRPYVALFEQVLVAHAVNISMRYDGAHDAPAYRATAETLRVAYWDWAQTPALPEAVALETVTVHGPSGPRTMPNPLRRYDFHGFPFQSAHMRHGELAAQNHTTRCPTADMAENVAAVNAGLSTSNLRAQVYEVFTTAKDFQDMETDHDGKPSFESPHNNVHNAVGCANGTMYDLGWSAFDPVFMLHHANVDRLIALWQAIYYNASLYTIAAYEAALFGTAAGTVSRTTPLKPFYDARGAFHTSESARDIGAFGYTYPELQPAAPAGGPRPAGLGADELSSYVIFRVNALYADNPPAPTYDGSRARRSSGAGAARGRRTGREAATRRTWSVAMRVDKAQVPLPATLKCYLGDNLVGNMALLGIPAAGITHSTIPLDAALDLSLADLGDEPSVLDCLAHKLRFEIQKGDGTTMDVASVPSLELTVVDRAVTQRKSNYDFPTYGAATTRPWPLDGRASSRRARGRLT